MFSKASLAIKVASDSGIYCNLCQNHLNIEIVNNKFANALPRALTKSISSLTPISRVSSHASNLGLILTPAPALAPALAILSTNDKLFKLFIKAYFEALIQSSALVSAPALVRIDPRKQFFKACFSKIFSGNLHIKCNKFCQHYKEYFNTA